MTSRRARADSMACGRSRSSWPPTAPEKTTNRRRWSGRPDPAFESPPRETLGARDSYTLFVMVTSEYQEHEMRQARNAASTLVIPANARIHGGGISAHHTATDLLDCV